MQHREEFKLRCEVAKSRSYDAKLRSSSNVLRTPEDCCPRCIVVFTKIRGFYITNHIRTSVLASPIDNVLGNCADLLSMRVHKTAANSHYLVRI